MLHVSDLSIGCQLMMRSDDRVPSNMVDAIHPNHTFIRIHKQQDYLVSLIYTLSVSLVDDIINCCRQISRMQQPEAAAHPAYCDECRQTIVGARYHVSAFAHFIRHSSN
jgi:hypothetical protein